MSYRRTLLLTPLAAVIAAVGPFVASGTVARATKPRLRPVVVFPAFHLTRLSVTVRNQTVDPACPRSGSFEDVFQNPHPGGRFSQVCRDKLMTLRYNPNPKLPMPRRFSNQPGVRISVIDYGKTDSAPYYGPMYRALEHAGYTANVNIRIAGYDARLTPDQGGFLHRAISLIEQTYHSNGDQPVELVGHSNGPLYAQYLLTHTNRAWRHKYLLTHHNRAWRHKYIHGFTPIAGNFPGQGSLYSIIFTGPNIENFSYPKTRTQ